MPCAALNNYPFITSLEISGNQYIFTNALRNYGDSSLNTPNS